MPIHRCTLKSGGTGYQWGGHGTCYPTRAQAERQAAAAHAAGFAGDERIKLISPHGKDIPLRPVSPNAGIEAEYRRRLKALIEKMHASINHWLLFAYKANEPEMAQDASPAMAMRAVMRKLSRQWLKNFDVGAGKLADWFAQKTKDYSDPALEKILKDAGFLVEFTMTRPMNDAYQAVIGEQVGLIRSIAQKHLSQVETIVMQGVQNGRDLSYISKKLQEQFGVTKRRAAFIARDQNNKATATLNRVRRLEIGIEEAIWVHSGGGKHPRPSHLKAGKDKLRYSVRQGAFIDGEYIQPGELINCRCVSRPIIPGLTE